MFVQIEDWRQYSREGGEYLATAEKGAARRPAVFTPATVYNLAAMAIEKFIMGYLMYHGDLAEGHTMADLASALERHTGELPELKAELLFLDSFQELCDLDTFKHRAPETDELARILAIARKVRDLTAAAIIQG